MKIGIFSDPHGHLDELNKTLALFESLKVDQIICAGDLVDKGTNTQAVVATIRALAIPCVQGNHDRKVEFAWLTKYETLDADAVDYLRNLPPSLSFYWAGISVYLCHSNPWQDPSIYAYPTRPIALFQMIADAVDAKVIIFGHTHHPMKTEIDGKLIINPGSIYGNRDRDERTCGLLSLPDCHFELYDIETGERLAF
jgi:putative phosphoesterase